MCVCVCVCVWGGGGSYDPLIFLKCSRVRLTLFHLESVSQLNLCPAALSITVIPDEGQRAA